MLRGDHQYRLCGVQDPRTAMVPLPLLVLPPHLQLLLLRRKPRRLLWSSNQQNGKIPPFLFKLFIFAFLFTDPFEYCRWVPKTSNVKKIFFQNSEKNSIF